MSDLRFGEFYAAVHGHKPFQWQERFAQQIISGNWPDAVSVPTAAGKTSVIDAFVFALALQADEPTQRTVPLRLFHVIDRRLVVDEVTEHAVAIAARLEAASDPRSTEPLILKAIAERLLRFGGIRPLHVVALRGGMYRNEEWARRPNQPTVGVSTIDQVGSRLLFRGYGLTDYRRPVHAGLLGADVLYIVDEAHLARPFVQTVARVAEYQAAAERPVAPPPRVLSLTATPDSTAAGFALQASERNDDALRERLAARKPAVLMEAADVAEELAKQAAALAASGEARVIGVVANRVSTARQVFSRLTTEWPRQAILLTGRVRPFERDQLLETFGPYMKVSRSERPAPPGGRLFVVATQTIEVGANLDFEALVTEAAPLSALRQRFGRLNRLGQRTVAPAVIVRRKERGSDPVYGDDLKVTWDWLLQHATKVKGQKHPIIDFGINELDRLLAEEGRPTEQVTDAPVLLPAYVRLWCQTSPRPHPDPDVASFLHGYAAADAADVHIVWRSDLHRPRRRADDIESGGNLDHWLDLVKLAPPLLREAVSVPVWSARRWLRELDEADNVTDITTTDTVGRRREQGRDRPVVIWRGPEQSVVGTAGDVRPGDTLVVPASDGGHDRFGWHPGLREPVPDIGDQEANEAARLSRRRQRLRLRLHEGLMALLRERFDDDPRQTAMLVGAWQTLLRLLRDEPDDDVVAARSEAAGSVIALLPEDVLEPSVAHTFLNADRRTIVPYPDGRGCLVMVPAGSFAGDEGAASDMRQAERLDEGDDEELAVVAERPVKLDAHLIGVGRMAAAFAANSGLPGERIRDLQLAGQWHDIGKHEIRFQALLRGGDEAAALLAQEPLAKSIVGLELPEWQRARRAAGYPRGARHEFMSVALLQSNPGLLSTAADPELVLYLIGTHHGRGRPFVPVVHDYDPETVEVVWQGERMSASTNHKLWILDSGWVELFWKLVRRYGPWGLAYLEAVLRLADGERSAEEERGVWE